MTHMYWHIFAVCIVILPGITFGQTASINDGNVFFQLKNGSTIPITSSGLDSDASLRVDNKLVVFVRRTPDLKINTGAGALDANQL